MYNFEEGIVSLPERLISLTVEQVRREQGEDGCRAEDEDGMAILAFTLTEMEPLDELAQIADII